MDRPLTLFDLQFFLAFSLISPICFAWNSYSVDASGPNSNSDCFTAVTNVYLLMGCIPEHASRAQAILITKPFPLPLNQLDRWNI